MARVATLGLSFLTKETTSYFYLGETLQHTTALHYEAISIIFFDTVDFKPCSKESPDMINAHFLVLPILFIL
jgi:hypothetical protein